MLNSIFICYRRNDAGDVTGRIYDRLVAEFPKGTVFRDVDDIPLAADFREHIQKAIKGCRIVLVVMGPTWATITGKDGSRRLEDEHDHVRIEVETALNSGGVAVVPLLVGNAEFPDEKSLPESLRPLVFRNGPPIRRDPDFQGDMNRLVRELRKLLIQHREPESDTHRPSVPRPPDTPELANALASFVPARLLKRFAIDPKPFAAPLEERIRGAVLFAEIIGVTSIEQLLPSSDANGVEQLAETLNDCFSPLIELIHSNGGDIAQFSGRALVALWDAEQGQPSESGDAAILQCDLTSAVRAASHCAFTMQQVLDKKEFPGGVHLSLRCGIDVGDLMMSVIGGVRDRWELLFSGIPLNEASRAARQVEAGGIVFKEGAWRLLGKETRGVRLPAGDWRLDDALGIIGTLSHQRSDIKVPPEACEALRQFTPNAVASRLGDGHDAWLTELRCTTILKVHLPDLTAPLTAVRIHAIIVTIQNTLYHFGGGVNDLDADDRGVTLSLSFGLPPDSHEDDAFRGVMAARIMQDKLRQLGLRSAIGIATGRVFCGAIGGQHRRQYAVLGVATSLASRIMRSAPGDILCDSATCRAVRQRIRFETLPEARTAEQAPLHRPCCQASPSSSRHAIFGRLKERATLIAALDVLKEGNSAIVLIEGEAGIGKSRLVAEFVNEAAARDVAVYTATGDDIEKTTPLHAWRSLFHQLFNIETSATAQERRNRVLHYLHDDPPAVRVAPLLNNMLALDLPENEVTSAMTGEVRADNTHELLLHLLEKACFQKRTAIVIEDGHWLDSSSWALAILACVRLTRAVVVIAARPITESPPGRYQMLLEHPRLRSLRLKSLDAGDLASLICERLRVASLPNELGVLIWEKSQGNPFFSEELAYALRDSGVVVVANGQCQLKPGVDLSEVKFPESVQGVITSRMDRLSEGQRLTLKVASIIGRIFGLRILRDIFPNELERPRLANHLHILDRLDLTSVTAPEPDTAYIFKHVITQEVAYDLVPRKQRKEYHALAANWYEAAGRDLSPMYPLLAYHWDRAGELEKAVTYLEKAGEQAVWSGAYVEAVKFLRHCLDLHPPPSTATGRIPSAEQSRYAKWNWLLGEAYLRLGELTAARERWHRVLRTLGQKVPGTGTSRFWGTARETALQLLHRLLPHSLLKGSQEEREACRMAAATYERIAHVCYYTGEARVGVLSAFSMINRAENAGTVPELARGYAAMAIGASVKGWRGMSEWYAGRSRAFLEKVTDPSDRAMVYLMLGLPLAANGRWEEGASHYAQASEIAASIGDWRRWAESEIQFAMLNHFQGRFLIAAEKCDAICQRAKQYGHRQPEAWALWGQAISLARLGEIGDAAVLVESARKVRGDEIGASEATWLYGVVALLTWLRGDHERALPEADRAAKILNETESLCDSTLEGFASVAQVYLEALERERDNTELKRKIAKSLKSFKRFALSFPMARPRACLWRGCAQWLLGRKALARKSWQAALTAAAKLRMPYEQGLAHYHLGRHLEARDANRAVHLNLAREILEDIGAKYDARRVEVVARHTPNSPDGTDLRFDPL